MKQVKAKKHLGQHFLTDLRIAQDIVDALTFKNYKSVIEIGPGMGVLSQFLFKKKYDSYHLVEIDTESVEYLNTHYADEDAEVLERDFLKIDFSKEPFGNDWNGAVIGNFPYNISSQILFKVLDNKNQIPEIVGMFQKEVAQRVASKPGKKAYGIISVLLQAYYDIEYLFDVGADCFDPPPKVTSGVIRLVRNEKNSLDCDEKLFKQVIKATFNQRRKTIRNGLKSIVTKKLEVDHPLLTQRPEQLSVEQFVELTNFVEKN